MNLLTLNTYMKIHRLKKKKKMIFELMKYKYQPFSYEEKGYNFHSLKNYLQQLFVRTAYGYKERIKLKISRNINNNNNSRSL